MAARLAQYVVDGAGAAAAAAAAGADAAPTPALAATLSGAAASSASAALPNFKRFRKVELLPSSVSAFGMQVACDAYCGARATQNPFAEEAAATAAAYAEGRRMFFGEGAQGAKKVKAPAKPRAPKD